MSYADGFVASAPQQGLITYRRMARKMGKIRRE